MVKTRLWVALCAAPVVIASAFCATPDVIASVGHVSWLGSPHELSTERKMSNAQTFERQGRIAKAKELYEQILAKESDSEEARRRLTKIIADEQRTHRKPSSATVAQSNRAKSSVARKAPAAVAALARRVASRLVEPLSSILDQRPKQANPLANVPPSPPKPMKTVTHGNSPRAAAAKPNRSAAIADVRGQPAVHESTVLPEKHSIISSTGPQPDSFRGMPGATPNSSDQFHSAPNSDDSFQVNDRAQAVFLLLGTLGPEAVAAQPSLREALRATQDSFLRIELAQTVLQIQPEDAEAIGILLELLHRPDDTVKWHAAFALRTSASPRTTFVVDALLETLVSDNHQLRRMVFLTLGWFGPAAAKAVPELVAALDSPDPRTRVVAEAALATIAPGRHRGLSVTQDPKPNQAVRFD